MPKYIKLFEAFINEATGLYIYDNNNPPIIAQGTWKDYGPPPAKLKYVKLTLGRLWAVADEPTVTSTGYNFYTTVDSADAVIANNLISIGGSKFGTSEYQGDMPDDDGRNYSWKAKIRFSIKASEISKLDDIANILSGTYSGTSGTSGTAGSAGDSGAGLGQKFDAEFQKLRAQTGLKNQESMMVVINLTAMEQAMFFDPNFKSKAVDALDGWTTVSNSGKKKGDPAYDDAEKAWNKVKSEWNALHPPTGSSGIAGTAGTSGIAGTAGT